MTNEERRIMSEQFRLQIIATLVEFYKATGVGIWSVEKLMQDADNILTWTTKTI